MWSGGCWGKQLGSSESENPAGPATFVILLEFLTVLSRCPAAFLREASPQPKTKWIQTHNRKNPKGIFPNLGAYKCPHFLLKN